MDIKEISFQPTGKVTRIVLDEQSYLIQSLDKKDNIISEYRTFSLKSAKSVYKKIKF